MTTRRRDDELDRLLQAEEQDDRAELAAALRSLRDTLAQPPSPAVAERHLAAMASAAVEAAHEAPRRDQPPVRSRGWARTRRVMGLTVAKVVIGVGAAAAATGTGLAATGNLPDPVQRVVADVAGRVGIDLPVPSPTTPGPVDAPGSGPATTAPPAGSGEPTAPPDDRGRPEDPGDRRATPTPRPTPGGPPSDVPGRGRPSTDPAGPRPEDPGGAAGGGNAPTDPSGPRGEGRGAEDADTSDRGRVPGDEPASDGHAVSPTTAPPVGGVGHDRATDAAGPPASAAEPGTEEARRRVTPRDDR